MRFPTNLPSDTILDCILDEHWEVNGILHIVDVIQWAKQDLTDCETTFRCVLLEARSCVLIVAQVLVARREIVRGQ
jgi:hypothetical protein